MIREGADTPRLQEREQASECEDRADDSGHSRQSDERVQRIAVLKRLTWGVRVSQGPSAWSAWVKQKREPARADRLQRALDFVLPWHLSTSHLLVPLTYVF